MWLDTDRSRFITAMISCNLHQNWKTQHNTCVYCLNNHITHTISISMHGYNDVSCYTLYKQWQCIIQLLLPIPCWCIKCESYVRFFFRIYTRSCVTLVRRYLSLRSCVRSCGTRAELVVCGRAVMPDARPSLFIFAVLAAVLRSGFRDTGHSYFYRVMQCIEVTLITKSDIPSTKSGHIVKYLLWTKSYTSALDHSNRTTSDQIADTHYQIGTIF